MSNPDADWLRTWVNAPQLRVAESALAHWLVSPDVDRATVEAATWSQAQARRAGYAMEVAIAAKLVARERLSSLLRVLRDRGRPADTPFARDAWQPDMAFEIGRLKQRAAEARRGDAPFGEGD